MKILYAIQGTGNGHLARAAEIAPALSQLADVDFLLSGRSAELDFPFPFEYNYHGLSFVFGKRGGVDYIESLRHFKPLRYLKDMKSCPVENYDVIVNDFEPITAWAGRRKKVPIIALSHQASFFSDKVPLPKRRNKLFEYGMKHIVAPADDYVGLHYRKYDENVLPPIIRDELLNAIVSDKGHVTVYLPAFADSLLVNHFKKLPEFKWEVFTKKSKVVVEEGNVLLHPVDKKRYSQSLVHCHGLLTGGGFQATSEGLYLKKKLMVIPMFDQYEQKCNAAALEKMGVHIVEGIKHDFKDQLQRWLDIENGVFEEPQYSRVEEVAGKVLEVAQGLVNL